MTSGERTKGSQIRVAVNALALAPGGGETFLVNQAREFLHEDDLELTYFVSPRIEDSLVRAVGQSHIRVVFDKHPPLVRRFYWEQFVMPRLLRRENFDALYSPGGFAILRSPIPQLVLSHNPNHHATKAQIGDWRLYLRVRMERWFSRLSLRRAERFVNLSQSFSDTMNALGFPKAVVIPSGVAADLAEPAPALPLSCERCRDHGFALAVHNWYLHKNLGWLVETWNVLEADDFPHLVIVGSPVRRLGPQDFLDRVDPRRIHFLESLSRSDVAALYSRARVYLSAASLEAFPQTPFEAMRFEVPCVLSDIPSHREVAEDAAFYFRLEDTAAFTEAVGKALADPSGVVAAGRSRTREDRFQWRSHVARLAEELRDIVDR